MVTTTKAVGLEKTLLIDLLAIDFYHTETGNVTCKFVLNDELNVRNTLNSIF